MRAVLAMCVMSATCLVALGLSPEWAEGQAGAPGPWTFSGGLSTGLALGDSDWSISHPFVGGGGTTWETLRGSFSHGVLLEGHLELRRGRLGIRGTTGILPQEFVQEAPAQVKELTLLMGGLSAVFHPLAGTGSRLEPSLSLGAGGQKATGELDSTGYFLSTGVGLGARVGARISLSGSLEYRRLKYTQIDLGNNIQKDLRGSPVFLSLAMDLRG